MAAVIPDKEAQEAFAKASEKYSDDHAINLLWSLNSLDVEAREVRVSLELQRAYLAGCIAGAERVKEICMKWMRESHDELQALREAVRK